MIISIDYDDTYTRDPLLWNVFITGALRRGHFVWCVSARHQDQMGEAEKTIGAMIGVDKCVGTNGVAKRDYLFKVREVYADVWIDDQPESVTIGYDLGGDIEATP